MRTASTVLAIACLA